MLHICATWQVMIEQKISFIEDGISCKNMYTSFVWNMTYFDLERYANVKYSILPQNHSYLKVSSYSLATTVKCGNR